MKIIKSHKLKFLLIFIVTVISSCNDDLHLNDSVINQEQAPVEKSIENGRFIFSSRESLSATVEDFKNENITNVEKEFEEIYERGFRSHKPMVNANNEFLQNKLSEDIMKRRVLKKSSNLLSKGSDEDIEEEEEFITDPFFASLINENNEIIVNDTLFKFTKEKGLFYTHIKDSTALINYVNKLSSTEVKNRAARGGENWVYPMCPYIEENQGTHSLMINEDGEIVEVENPNPVRIIRYIRPLNGKPCDDGTITYPWQNNGPIIPKIPKEIKLQSIINDLPVCEGRDNWFQNLFGKSYYCTNNFDSKHRIKTEFWDQKWLIYASAGIQTKTQRKRFGIWWASKSDEIHLGINKIFLKYKRPEPEINSLSHPNLFTNFGKAPIYMYNAKYYTKYNKINNWVETSINVTKNNIPFFDYDNDDILNIYIPKVPIIGDVDINLTTGNTIYTESNIKALYKLGFDFLKSKGSSKKKFVVMYQKNEEEIEVLYFADRFKKTNDNKIKHKFYSDVSFKISIAKCLDCENGGIKFKVGPSDAKFRDYTHYELDFYGMARRGNTWKGNRMIR